MSFRFRTNITSSYAERVTSGITGSPLTISAWIRPLDIVGIKYIVSVSNASGGVYFALIQSGNTILAESGGTSTRTATSTGVVVAGTWYHVCAVFPAGDASRSVYIDGGNVGVNSQTTAVNVSGGGIGLALQYGKARYYFQGDIAEVGVWNTDLTAIGVTNLANGVEPTLIRPTGLVSYIPLFHHSSGWNDVTESGTLFDYKRAEGYTIYNAPTYQTHIRVIRRSGFDTPNMFPYQHSWSVGPGPCSILL